MKTRKLLTSLAAIGIDELNKTVSQTVSSVNAKRQMIALIVTAMIAIITLLVVPERIVSNVSPFISVTILLVLTLITWFAIHSKLQRRNTLIAVVWGGASLTLLAIEVPWIPPPSSSSIFLTSKVLALDMAIERVVALDPEREYRVIFDGKIEKQQAAMFASYRGVRTFNSNFSPAPRNQFEELYYHAPRVDNYFRILGAKYLICDKCTAASLNGYKYLESVAGYEIYQTDDVLPHSYIVQRLNGGFSSLADFVNKAAKLDLTKRLLFVESSALVELKGMKDVADNNCISREDSRSVNHSRFVVQCKSAGVLVMNEFFDKAWKITVDGVKTKSLKVNGNQIGAPFTSGSHIIEFRYAPKIFLFSLWLMFAGIVICAFLIWKIRKRD